MIFFSLIFSLIGLFIGSFLLVIIDRFGSNESFTHGRSRCDHCKKTLSPLDLIPVLSFLSTGGRCRYCHMKLPLMYPLFELLTGFLFGLTVFRMSGNIADFDIWYGISIFFSLYITASLLLIFFIDYKYGIIPFKIIFPAILITCVFDVLFFSSALLPYIYASFGAFAFFLILFLITKSRGMGFGDVVYAFFMGLLLGFPNIVVGLYIAFLAGAVISLILVWRKKKKLQGSTIPFGPFLVAGSYLAWLWGSEIVALGMKFLLQV